LCKNYAIEQFYGFVAIAWHDLGLERNIVSLSHLTVRVVHDKRVDGRVQRV
jgi:hypothetical protein